MDTASREEGAQRTTRIWRIVGAAMAGIVTVAVAIVAGMTWSWHQSLVDEERLLPGTTVAGADLGERTVGEARAVAQAAADGALTRTVVVTDEDGNWEKTPAEFDASTDAVQVVESAWDATVSASPVDLLRIRWLGGTADVDLDVSVTVPEDRGSAFVDAVAERIDRPPEDAAIDWNDDGLSLREHVIGRETDRSTAVSAVRAALEGAADHVELPVDELPPAVDTVMVEAAFPAVERSVDAALDHTVTVEYGDAVWEVTPRDLRAVPDVDPILETALARTDAEPDADVTAATDVRARPVGDTDLGLAAGDVSLAVPDSELAGLLETMADQVDRSPQNARLDYSSGWVSIEPERAGRAIDRETAGELLRAALRGDSDSVELPVEAVAPAVTTDDYDRVLLVRQDERRLYLYVDGEIVRNWPVAVGTGGSPTPTGQFTVGAKRHGPTWHNPAPNGWGADMPAVIGPGPDNPLGLRALNWNQGGHDTLIRFHGTSNTGSIGQAASQGCVRLTNADVVELYDLVPTGAAIVSLHG